MLVRYTGSLQKCLVWSGMILLLGSSIGLSGNAFGSDADNILCKDASPGDVKPLPKLVEKWVTVICTPLGQALAPMVQKDVVLWVNKGNGKPFLVQAYPFAPPLPGSLTGKDIRFLKFASRKLEGDKKRKTLKMWEIGFEKKLNLQINDVIQLDALSIYNNIVFNLFFYTINDIPKWLIVCLNRCQLNVFVEILSGKDLKKTLRN